MARPTPRASVPLGVPAHEGKASAAREPYRTGAARFTPVTPLLLPRVEPEEPPPAAPPQEPAPPRKLPRSVRRRQLARRVAWTVMVLPPAQHPGAVRTYTVRPWYARALFATVGVMCLLSLGAGAWMGSNHQQGIMGVQIDDARAHATSLEERLGSALDSLARVSEALLVRMREAEARPAAPPARAAPARRTPVATSSARATRPAGGIRPSEGVLLPVDGRITSAFSRSRLHPILRVWRPHNGLDIAAPSGTPVTAPASGRVARVSRDIGYGLVVHLEHADGVETRFAHLRGTNVREGEVVERGRQIGTVGSSGLATAPHLHYEVRVRGRAVDPLRHVFADARGSTLAPVVLPAELPLTPALPAAGTSNARTATDSRAASAVGAASPDASAARSSLPEPERDSVRDSSR